MQRRRSEARRRPSYIYAGRSSAEAPAEGRMTMDERFTGGVARPHGISILQLPPTRGARGRPRRRFRSTPGHLAPDRAWGDGPASGRLGARPAARALRGLTLAAPSAEW